MNIRRAWTLFCYDQWLDLYGCPGRARKDLVRELKANLIEADAGWEAARAGISVRGLAHENAEAARDPRRPAWNVGSVWAALTFAYVVIATFLAATAFWDGAHAAGLPNGQTVEGTIVLLPGTRAEYTPTEGGMEFGVQLSPWLCIGLPVLAFLVGSRIWRLWRSRS